MRSIQLERKVRAECYESRVAQGEEKLQVYAVDMDQALGSPPIVKIHNDTVRSKEIGNKK
jgi:hypothetical protein